MCRHTKNCESYLPLSQRVAREKSRFARFAEAVEAERNRSTSFALRGTLGPISASERSVVRKVTLETGSVPITSLP
jgi:hypothetical protein